MVNLFEALKWLKRLLFVMFNVVLRFGGFVLMEFADSLNEVKMCEDGDDSVTIELSCVRWVENLRLGFAWGEQMEEIVFVVDGSVDNFNLVKSLRECEYLVGFLWERDCIEINYCFMLN